MNTEGLKTILYVDDESDICEIVEMSLGMMENVSIRTCESGERALEMLSRVKPDMILLDVMMPGMDGPTTLQNIRARPEFANIPIVFLTAKAMPQEVARFKQLGAVEVIPKPFDPMQLAAQVGAIWNQRRGSPPPLPAKRMADIGARFLQRTLGEVQQLRECISAPGATAAASVNQIRHLAHRMHGSGATMGFKPISDVAGRLEATAEQGIAMDADAESAFRKQCHALLDQLELEVHRAQA